MIREILFHLKISINILIILHSIMIILNILLVGNTDLHLIFVVVLYAYRQSNFVFIFHYIEK